MNSQPAAVDPKEKPVALRPLGIVKNLVEAMHLDISYVYEDLVFVEHNAFLLQMSSEKGEDIVVWFNEESTPEDRPQIFSRLQQTGHALGLLLQDKGTYSIDADDGGDSLKLRFMPAE